MESPASKYSCSMQANGKSRAEYASVLHHFQKNTNSLGLAEGGSRQRRGRSVHVACSTCRKIVAIGYNSGHISRPAHLLGNTGSAAAIVVIKTIIWYAGDPRDNTVEKHRCN
jgi:hypothetical protein